MTAGDAANGVKPMGAVDYGQFDAPHTGHDWHRSSTTTNPMAPRRIPFAPVTPKVQAFSVSAEWIEGAQAILNRSENSVAEDREELVEAIGEYILAQYEEVKEGNA